LALPKTNHAPPSPEATITSLSKAFFCGKLPEVLLVHAWPGDEALLVQGLVKLLAMQSSTGYWLASGRYGGELAHQVQLCFPKILLVGEGMMYSSFCNRLLWQLQQVTLATQGSQTDLQALLLGQITRVLTPPSAMFNTTPPPAQVQLLSINETACRRIQSHFHTLCWPSRVRMFSKAVIVQAEWQHWLAHLPEALAHPSLPQQGLNLEQTQALLQAVAHHHGWQAPPTQWPKARVNEEEKVALEAGGHHRSLAMLADYASKQGFWRA